MPKAVNGLPFQPMTEPGPVQISRLAELYDTPSFKPHRHNFYMIMWTTEGCGEHLIDFKHHQIVPNRVFFVHQGQIHQFIKYPADGWYILFDEFMFRAFLDSNIQQQQSGILDYIDGEPFVDLNEETLAVFQSIFELLKNEVKHFPSGSLVKHYINILLINANRIHKKTGISQTALGEQVRKLKVLIEKYYKTEKSPAFYSQQLNLHTRKLNQITSSILGKSIFHLINERLITEAKALLITGDCTVKEISFQLGFEDPSYFCRFFKKQTGYSPNQFKALQNKGI